VVVGCQSSEGETERGCRTAGPQGRRTHKPQGDQCRNRETVAVHTCCRAHTDTRTHGRGWPHRVSLLPFHVSTRHLSHLPSTHTLSLSLSLSLSVSLARSLSLSLSLRHLKGTGSPAHSTSLVPYEAPNNRLVQARCMACNIHAFTHGNTTAMHGSHLHGYTQAPSAMTCTTYVPTAACASNQRKLEPTLLVHFTAAPGCY
jgi:hypothetical protein